MAAIIKSQLFNLFAGSFFNFPRKAQVLSVCLVGSLCSACFWLLLHTALPSSSDDDPHVLHLRLVESPAAHLLHRLSVFFILLRPR